MDVQLKEQILDFMIERRAELSGRQLQFMMRFLGLPRLPPSLQAKLARFEDLLVQEELAESLALWAVQSVLATSRVVNTVLFDQWVDRALATPTPALDDALSAYHAISMESVARVVALQRDTPAGRALLLRLAVLLEARLELEPELSIRPMVGVLLALAQVRR